MAENPIKTVVIDNFTGRLSRLNYGDSNSGYTRYQTTYGNDPFTNPGNLQWYERPTQIDPNSVTITDLIMAGKPRLENGITYVYAIGHLGRLYKIQVNDPTTYNPNYDNPVLLTTLTVGTPTFKYGSSIQFYGATEKIYIGHDKGVTSVNFDGTGEAAVGIPGPTNWVQNVPRLSVNFTGILYYTNGTNIAAIDSTATVTTYTKLAPAFPVGTQARDIDVSPDGNYVFIVVARIPQADMTTSIQDTSSLSSGDSYFIQWNGTDAGYTAYNPYLSYSINTNTSFGAFGYTMGNDLGGAAIYSGPEKIITLPVSNVPTPNAMFSTGNLLGFGAPEQDGGFLKGSVLVYGQYDLEVPTGLYRFFRASAGTPETDVIQMPYCGIVSNLLLGSSSAGYANNQVGNAKIYYSTLETSSSPTATYNLYKFTTVPTGVGTAIGGVYETQTQLYGKKVKLSEVRIYVEPLVLNNSFKLELMGSDGNVIPGTTKTFTAQNADSSAPAYVGSDYLWFTPQSPPTWGVGVRITNLGTADMTFVKVEYDYTLGGT